jgi:hypothetical protein
LCQSPSGPRSPIGGLPRRPGAADGAGPKGLAVNTTHVGLVWKLVPMETPLVVRDCPKCAKRSRFYCSEKFRVNAQQRSLDVWLIYRCETCDSTWNCSILRRVSPASIEPGLYERFLNNDRGESRRYAFDLELLKRNGVRVEHRGGARLEGPELRPEHWLSGTALVVVTCDLAGRWRLDKVLAAKLRLSRTKLQQLFDGGGLEFEPPLKQLRAPLKERTIVVVKLGELAALRDSGGGL